MVGHFAEDTVSLHQVTARQLARLLQDRYLPHLAAAAVAGLPPVSMAVTVGTATYMFTLLLPQIPFNGNRSPICINGYFSFFWIETDGSQKIEGGFSDYFLLNCYVVPQ